MHNRLWSGGLRKEFTKKGMIAHSFPVDAEGGGLEPPQAYARRFSRPLQYHYANPPIAFIYTKCLLPEYNELGVTNKNVGIPNRLFDDIHSLTYLLFLKMADEFSMTIENDQ